MTKYINKITKQIISEYTFDSLPYEKKKQYVEYVGAQEKDSIYETNEHYLTSLIAEGDVLNSDILEEELNEEDFTFERI